MSLRNILFLALAVVVAAGTAVYVKTWIGAERARAEAKRPGAAAAKLAVTMVLVAKKTLVAGSFVKPDLLEWKPWPEDGIIEGYMVKQPGAADTDGEAEDPRQAFEGAVVRTELAAGQPVTEDRVVHPGERGFLAAVLEPGLRAVSVPVNATTGISGFIFPGDWVDVLLTMRVKSDENGKAKTRYFSQTLLAGIRVLAIDQSTENVDGKAAPAKTATIQVTPKQAEEIAIALTMGDLSLSLRSLARDEEAPAPVKPVRGSYTLDMDVYNMLGDKRLFGGAKAAGQQVYVLRGADAETAKF